MSPAPLRPPAAREIVPQSAPPAQPARYLTNDEAAACLRLSPRTLEKQRVIGGGPRFRKFGRRVMYAAADLEAWADARSFEATYDPEYAARRAGIVARDRTSAAPMDAAMIQGCRPDRQPNVAGSAGLMSSPVQIACPERAPFLTEQRLAGGQAPERGATPGRRRPERRRGFEAEGKI